MYGFRVFSQYLLCYTFKWTENMTDDEVSAIQLLEVLQIVFRCLQILLPM